MKFYRVLGGKFEEIWGKAVECIWNGFEAIKRGLERSWEKVMEYYLIVWIGLGLIFAYPWIVKIFGG